ncbi:MAG: hypothetical protein H7067_07685 [Burkholderiales bacterium]|nr:hypothetical protein [Opitutaceae bacterium]
MRTPRQNRIDRALARVLTDAAPYLIPDTALREDMASRVVPRPTATEIEEAVRHADTERRLTSVPGETGPKWKLNDAGQAWASENL